MKILKLAALAATALVALPAAATTYDITAIGTPFSYAQYNGSTSFTPFSSGCASRPDLASCFEGPDGAGAAQVVYDAGALIAHPGSNGTTAVLFTAPTSALYSFNLVAALADPNALNTDGVAVLGYGDFFGGIALPLTTLQFYGTASATANFAGSLFLNAGQRIGLVFDRVGSNGYDSVALTGTVSAPAVPEPATWAMMIGGFALAGAAMRRTKAVVSFA